jgi:hypothetical protein
LHFHHSNAILHIEIHTNNLVDRPPLPSGLWLYSYEELIHERRQQVRAAIMTDLVAHNGISRVTLICERIGIKHHIVAQMARDWPEIRSISIQGKKAGSWYCVATHPVVPIKLLPRS